MNEYEDRRHTRQRDYDNRDERNKERFQRFDNRTFAGRQNQRSIKTTCNYELIFFNRQKGCSNWQLTNVMLHDYS